MFDFLQTVIPYNTVIGAFIRMLVSIASLAYGNRLLTQRSMTRAIPILFLSAWLFIGGLSQGYDPLAGKLTWWGVIMYLLLFTIFGRMALRNLRKEDI